MSSKIPTKRSLTSPKQFFRQTLAVGLGGCLAGFLALTTAKAMAATPQKDQMQMIQQRGVLRIGVSPDLPGMSRRTAGKPGFEGAEASLALLIGTGLLDKTTKVALVGVDSPERLERLADGTIDLVIAQLTITAQRQQLVDFSTPYLTAHEALLLPVNSPVERLSQLIGKQVSVAEGSASQQRYKTSWPGIGLRSTNLESGGFELLRRGEVSAWANDNTNILGTLTAAPDRQRFRLLDVGACFPAKPFGIAIKKGNPGLLALINARLAEQERTGKLQKLFAAVTPKPREAPKPEEACR
jgi:ABC-type amino acid transport substrate-binding protein